MTSHIQTPDTIGISSAVLEDLERHLIKLRNFYIGSYKDTYVKRRINIRIRATRCSSAEGYRDLLLHDETELDMLLKALNIHVSQFFRNPSMFEKLRVEIIPELLFMCERNGKDRLLFWSVGCAGGEEAYTLAMIMRHFFPREHEEGKFSIIATDVDEEVLEAARAGIYRAERLADLPEELKNRYFTSNKGGFQLAEEIRSMVSFHRSDLFQPDDFIPSDLILCRNVLIYFERWQQVRIIDRFAEVLRSGGFLVLGRAETLCDEHKPRFETVCPSERIYRLPR